jgi:hypothetical protein
VSYSQATIFLCLAYGNPFLALPDKNNMKLSIHDKRSFTGSKFEKVA